MLKGGGSVTAVTRQQGVRGRIFAGAQHVYSYLYFMFASSLLTSSPVPGAVLCLAAQSVSHLIRAARVLRSRAEVCWQSLTCLALVAALLVTGVRLQNSGLLYLMAVLALARAENGRLHTQQWKRLIYGLSLLTGGVVMLLTLPRRLAWLLLTGFAVDHLLGLGCPQGEALDAEAARGAADALRKTHLGRTSFRLLAALLCTGELTKATMLRLTSLTLVPALSALVLMVLGLVLAVLLHARWEDRHGTLSDPTHVLLGGLALWFFGAAMLMGAGSVWLVLAMTVMGMGCGLSCRAMLRIAEGVMNALRVIAAQHAAGWQGLCDAVVHFGLLTGAAVSAAVLTVLVMGGEAAVLGLAVLLSVVVSLATACKFPLSKRYLDKLTRLLKIEASGRVLPELRAQLEERVTGHHHQSLVIDLIIWILKRTYRHTLIDVEHVRADEDNPLVLLCNHGDLYGPVVSVVHTSMYKRPWSIGTLFDHQTAFEYTYKYDWSVKKWMPVWARKLCAHFVSCVGTWGMDRLEAIPVFRDRPVELRKTFRLSVDALAAGDALLIFPENPNAAGVDHGYETTGVGELFSGFTMLASSYYNRTGKCCRFLPMFAHQPSSTIQYGTEIVFDPDNDPAAERQRITDEASAQMQAMFEQLEARWQQANA